MSDDNWAIGAALQGFGDGLAKGLETMSKLQSAKAQAELARKKEERAQAAEERATTRHNAWEKKNKIDESLGVQIDAFEKETNLPVRKVVDSSGEVQFVNELGDPIENTEIISKAQMVKEGKMAPSSKIIQDPNTGDIRIADYNKDGTIKKISPHYQDVTPGDKQEELLKSNGKTWGPQLIHFKWLDREQGKLDTRIRKPKESLLSVDKMANALSNPNKLTGSLVRTQMPRIMGEVGNLAAFEQMAWEGSPEIIEKMKRWVNTNFSDVETLTDKDILVLKQTIQQAKGVLENNINNEKKKSMTRMNQRGIPRSFSGESFGYIKPKENESYQDEDIMKYIRK